MKRHLPNALTCVNLLCGCIALTFIFGGNLVVAAYFVGIAAVADFFDGLVARALRVSSPIGKDLDYYCSDNLPVELLPDFVKSRLRGNPIGDQRLAVGIDVRSRSDLTQLAPS